MAVGFLAAVPYIVRLHRHDRGGPAGRSHRQEDQQPDHRVRCRSRRPRRIGRVRAISRRALGDYAGARRHHVGARDLLDDSDAVPDGVGAAAGLAFINSIGTLGGFVGPYAMGWLRDLTGSFSAGLMAMAGMLVLATLLAASLKLVIKVE